MKTTKYILAVIESVIGEDKFNLTLKDIYNNINYKEFKRTELKDNNNMLSKNQKVGLFAYIYLYCILSNDNDLELKTQNALNILSLPKSLAQNCKSVLTAERVLFIKDDFSNHQKEFENMFYEVDTYISNVINDIVNMPIAEEKKKLINLNAHNYEHPIDRVALEKLQLNPAMEKVLKIFSEYELERLLKIQYTGSLLQVTESNIPYLYNILKEACSILEIKDVPPLYLEQGFINGYTIGINQPMIVLSNATLSLLTHDELLFIIGHELGHIKSQHVLYHSVGRYLPYIGNFLGNLTFGIGDILSSGLELAIYNWQRMSEFTADRAGLLACQNIDAAISVMCKIAGYPPSEYHQMDNKYFLEQAEQFEEFDSSKFNKVLKILSAAYNTHPWTVMRAKELKKWVDDKSYSNILNQGCENMQICSNCGNYIKNTAKFCSSCGVKID